MKAGLNMDELRGKRRMTTSQHVYEVQAHHRTFSSIIAIGSYVNMQCEICIAEIGVMEKISVSCGHHICHECWTKYADRIY